MSRGPRRWVVLAMAALVAACGSAPPAAQATRLELLATLAPAAALHDPAGPGLPEGARLVRVALGDAARPVDLAPGFAAAGLARVAYDGQGVVFSAREAPGGPLGLWRCRPDGSGREHVAKGASDQVGGAWLPDGRFVCSLSLGEGTTRRWALGVAALDGGPAQRITFGAGPELDPEVLPDGRIVFAARRATSTGTSYALWSVHPDGTGADLHHRPASEAALLRRPRVLPDGRLAVLMGPTATELSPWLVDARRPLGPARGLPGAGGALAAVEPLADGRLLVLAADGALTLVDAEGRATPLAIAGAGERVIDVAVLEPRARPQGHLSMVDASHAGGQVLVLDARPPGHPGAARLRLRTGPEAPGGPAAATLGSVGLAEDGSAFVRVPADTALWFDVLGADGVPIASTHAALWVRPRETRACVGCHDDRESAPPNRRPLAVLAPAQRLATGTAAVAAEVVR